MARIHKCFKDLDKVLKEHNTQLVTDLFDPNQIFIDTMKIDSKKRGKPKLVLASYCPFCGKKLPKSKSPF